MTYQMIYSSQAAHPMSLSELQEILVDARAGNARRGVTGALVYVDGVFLQILEGERDALHGLMRRITTDTRHGAVTVFHEGEVDAPMFSRWQMAFVDATPDQMAAWAGLPGAASVDAIVQDVRRAPERAAHVARGILDALVG